MLDKNPLPGAAQMVSVPRQVEVSMPPVTRMPTLTALSQLPLWEWA